MGSPERRLRQALLQHGIGVVLGRDLDAARIQIPDRMVAAPVAELELVGLRPVGQGQDLVAQADPEDRDLSQEGPDGADGLRHILGIAGAVGEEDPVRPETPDLLCRRVPGHDGHLTAPAQERAHDVLLHAAVDRDDMAAPFFPGQAAGPDDILRVIIDLLFTAADPGDRIGRQRVVPHDGKAPFHRRVRVGDQGLPGPEIPDGPRQGAGVDPGNARDPAGLHDLSQRLLTAEIGGLVVVFPDDQGAQRRHRCLVVIRRHPVIADQGIGHDDRLVRVGGIREDLLVAGHGCVEDDLADPVPGAPESMSVKFLSVFQNDLSVVLIFHLSFTSSSRGTTGTVLRLHFPARTAGTVLRFHFPARTAGTVLRFLTPGPMGP